MTRVPVALFRQLAAALLCLLSGGDSSHSNLDTVTVTVLESTGNPVIGASVIAIDNSGNSLVSSPALTDASGVVTFTTVQGQTIVELAAGAPGCTSVRLAVIAFPATAELTISCGDAIVTGVTDDVIAFVDYFSAGSGTPACVDDGLMRGVGRLPFSTNALALGPSPSACHGAIGVLSKDRAFWFSNDESSMPWTNELGDQVLATLPADRLDVPVKIYLSDVLTAAAEMEARNTIDGYITNAEGLLRLNYTGLRLQLITASDGTSIDVVPSGSVAGLGTTCETAGQNIAPTSFYDAGRINVFFVPTIGGTSRAGFTCTAWGYPNIIFVTHPAHPYTLVHEIGHALGLIRPNWGHTGTLTGFTRDPATQLGYNLMAENSEGDLYLSIGQVAQMNLSTQSWLNLPSASDASTLRSRAGAATATVVPCGCPENNATTYCPALSLDVARDGTLQIPPAFPTSVANCSVAFDLPTIDLLCASGTSADVTARFTTGTGAGAEAVWLSLTPTIVSAAAKPADSQLWYLSGAPDTSIGTVTAQGVAGTGTVRVWADGTYADFTVNVHC
jgi:hypothetical protein